MALREGGWCLLVVTGRSEEVTENLEYDADASSWVADVSVTVGSQRARESPGEDARRVVHKTFYDCSWLPAQLFSGRGTIIRRVEG